MGEYPKRLYNYDGTYYDNYFKKDYETFKSFKEDYVYGKYLKIDVDKPRPSKPEISFDVKLEFNNRLKTELDKVLQSF